MNISEEAIKQISKDLGLNEVFFSKDMVANNITIHIGINLKYDLFEESRVGKDNYLRDFCQQIDNAIFESKSVKSVIDEKNSKIEELNKEIIRLKDFETYYNMHHKMINGDK